MYEMVKNVPPFYKSGEPPEFSQTTDEFRDLVLRLIERDPLRRLTSFA